MAEKLLETGPDGRLTIEGIAQAIEHTHPIYGWRESSEVPRYEAVRDAQHAIDQAHEAEAVAQAHKDEREWWQSHPDLLPIAEAVKAERERVLAEVKEKVEKVFTAYRRIGPDLHGFHNSILEKLEGMMKP